MVCFNIYYMRESGLLVHCFLFSVAQSLLNRLGFWVLMDLLVFGVLAFLSVLVWSFALVSKVRALALVASVCLVLVGLLLLPFLGGVSYQDSENTTTTSTYVDALSFENVSTCTGGVFNATGDCNGTLGQEQWVSLTPALDSRVDVVIPVTVAVNNTITWFLSAVFMLVGVLTALWTLQPNEREGD